MGSLKRMKSGGSEGFLSLSDDDDFFPLSQTDNPRRDLNRSRLPSALSSNGNGTDTVVSADGEENEQALPIRRLAQKRPIHDRIHGLIDFDPLLMAVIDTPEFQRLRQLKQLGGSNYVYPGACHTRFEHCLGVSYLAGLMAQHLANLCPEVTPKDILCVKLAGLCHDLGHGPFSHNFELFVNRVRAAEGKPHWEHEDASIAMLVHLLDTNNIDIGDYGLEQSDLNFTLDLIGGLKPGKVWDEERYGRPKSKRFLFDIVANKRNGIDVDKLDYFLRDGTNALGKPPIQADVTRIIRCCKPLEVKGEMQVCFEEKMALSLMDIFKLRAWLHKYVYQHHTVNVVEEMICDTLTAANEHFKLAGKDGTLLRLSDACSDMTAFSKMGDWLFDAIGASVEPGLTKAKSIVHRLRCRDLYLRIGVPYTLAGKDLKLTTDDLKLEILQYVVVEGSGLTQDEIARDTLVHFVEINYGSKDQYGVPDNPILHVTFFNPKHPEKGAYPIHASQIPDLFTPRSFLEKLAFVFSRSERAAPIIADGYQKWMKKKKTKNNNLRTPVANTNPPSPYKSSKLNSKKRKGGEVDV